VAFTAPPCPAPPLAASEAHLWLAALETPAQDLARYAVLLSPDERERAARFHFERDQRHYIAARGILRLLLAHYTASPADKIRFSYNAHGKPSLTSDHPCRFNVGHSHGWGIFGFILERDVGVDVERIRADFAGEDIAQRFFSPAETAALRTVPQPARTKAFFDCWTRKEAFIKAKGLGVFLGLHTFAVSLKPDEPPALLWHESDPEASARWTMLELQTPEGYVGAAAIEGTGIIPRGWRWT
jgi:4'-phosphopantetheinyl transferase